jgi:hypothetical protein
MGIVRFLDTEKLGVEGVQRLDAALGVLHPPEMRLRRG